MGQAPYLALEVTAEPDGTAGGDKFIKKSQIHIEFTSVSGAVEK